MSIELCTSTLKKLNSKIIPFIIICYFVANLDKTNISIAALQMNADLGLTASMYGLGVGMFYISYIIFEIPSNLIATRVGARIWIARIMITWGMVSAGMAFVQTPTQLYIMRFLLRHGGGGIHPRDYLLYLLLVSEAQPGAGDVVLLYGIGAGVDHRAARLGADFKYAWHRRCRRLALAVRH